MHKKTGLLDREARFAEDLPSALQVRRQTPMVFPPRMARSKLGGRFRTEGILVREADGAWVNFNCPGTRCRRSFFHGFLSPTSLAVLSSSNGSLIDTACWNFSIPLDNFPGHLTHVNQVKVPIENPQR